jgi:hypothetical protein
VASRKAKRAEGLAHVHTSAQVSARDGLPSVLIEAEGTDGTVLRGRVAPSTAQEMAAWMMLAAHAAEVEAAVVAELREMGLDGDHIVQMLLKLRDRRDRQRPDAEAKHVEDRDELRRRGEV